MYDTSMNVLHMFYMGNMGSITCVLHWEYGKRITLKHKEHGKCSTHVLHGQCILHVLHEGCLWTSTKQQLTISSPMTSSIWKANLFN